MIDLKNLADFSEEPILKEYRDKKIISVFGVPRYSRPYYASLLDKVLYICSDYVSAGEVYEQMKALRSDVVLLPSKGDTLISYKMRSRQIAFERYKAMLEIVKGRAGIVVATVEAAAQLFPLPETFASAAIKLKVGESVDMSVLAQSLSRAGYTREMTVQLPGQFAVRGDIVDIFPVGSDYGIRAEFFGDEIDVIKKTDFSTQLSSEVMDSMEICPITECFGGDFDNALEALKKEANGLMGEPKEKLLQLCEDIELQGFGSDFSPALLPYAPHCLIKDFVKPETVIFDEVKRVNLDMLIKEHRNRFTQLSLAGGLPKGAETQLCSFALDFDCGKIGFYNFLSSNGIYDPKGVIKTQYPAIPQYIRNREGLTEDIKIWIGNGYKVHFFVDALSTDSIKEFLAENGIYFSESGNGKVNISSPAILHGAILPAQKLVIIGTRELFPKSAKTVKRAKKEVFGELKIGDYVVHHTHGIGICDDIRHMDLGDGVLRDYAIIRYKNNDKLLLPIENLDSLSRYIGGENAPALSKIGGAEFARVKEKVRKSVQKLAFDLVKLYAERSKCVGKVYYGDEELMEEFEADFPYAETEDQLTAIADGMKDLRTGKVMERLLCGDVGYGKTEVALRLAFRVILSGGQVAFISPTTILARQHFHTATERMEKFGVKVALLTRHTSTAEAKKILGDLATGKIDMLIGTHRILSKDVVFANLEFLILDEEQRFGVGDKEKIKLLKKNINVLTLSATPIPRTLHMSLVGIRDISILDTPPAERIPVQTFVSEYSDELMVDAVTREVERGGQVFVVYNRVETMPEYAGSLASLLDKYKVDYVHGQLPEERIENSLEAFIDGKTDVLVTSTIVENGIDIANANTMIVVDSDRLGLSQMYQLRGRIGRGNRLAYVFFTFDGRKIMTETAEKRLDAITEFTEFGSGFKIAMRDLEIRGAGNILGKEQHGHMEKVGYDMYCKILSEAVKGGAETAETDIKVSVDFSAFIPEGYIRDSDWRVRVYSRIAHLASVRQRDSLLEDLKDIYGEPPQTVKDLVQIGLIKNLAGGIGAQKVGLKKRENTVYFAKLSDVTEKILKASESYGGVLRVNDTPYLGFEGDAEGREKLIKFLVSCA